LKKNRKRNPMPRYSKVRIAFQCTQEGASLSIIFLWKMKQKKKKVITLEGILFLSYTPSSPILLSNIILHEFIRHSDLNLKR